MVQRYIAGDASSIPGWEYPMEEGMATSSSILAWRIPRTEEPGGLPRVHRVAKSWTGLKLLSKCTQVPKDTGR